MTPQRSRLRNEKIGFIFQAFNLFHRPTVAGNVEVPLLLSRSRPDDAHVSA